MLDKLTVTLSDRQPGQVFDCLLEAVVLLHQPLDLELLLHQLALDGGEAGAQCLQHPIIQISITLSCNCLNGIINKLEG